jgi:hypothetical protein
LTAASAATGISTDVILKEFQMQSEYGAGEEPLAYVYVMKKSYC